MTSEIPNTLSDSDMIPDSFALTPKQEEEAAIAKAYETIERTIEAMIHCGNAAERLAGTLHQVNDKWAAAIEVDELNRLADLG